MRAQRAPLRLTVSPARLCRAVYAGFLAVRWRTILAWDSKSHGGTMPEGHLHLTYEQRCQIYALLQSGHSQAHIARKIGVDPSSMFSSIARFGGAATAWVISDSPCLAVISLIDGSRCRDDASHRVRIHAAGW